VFDIDIPYEGIDTNTGRFYAQTVCYISTTF